MFNNIINIFSDPDNESIIDSMVFGADKIDIEIIKHILILFSLCINGNLSQETIIQGFINAPTFIKVQYMLQISQLNMQILQYDHIYIFIETLLLELENIQIDEALDAINCIILFEELIIDSKDFILLCISFLTENEGCVYCIQESQYLMFANTEDHLSMIQIECVDISCKIKIALYIFRTNDIDKDLIQYIIVQNKLSLVVYVWV